MQTLGFVLFAAGAVCAMWFWSADQQLQSYRLHDRPESSYWFVPLRVRQDLYRPEAKPLVRRAWRLLCAMYLLVLSGMVLVAVGSGI